MHVGDTIAVQLVEFTILNPIVNITNATSPISIFRTELDSLVNGMDLDLPTGSVTTTNFKVQWDSPLTFQSVFATTLRKSASSNTKSFKIKNQLGAIKEYPVEVYPDASVYIPVIGQLVRSIFLKKLFLVNEPSQERSLRLSDLEGKIADLANSPMILAPVVDELIGAADGSVYLYKETITSRDDMYQVLNYADLPVLVKSDFAFLQDSALLDLYKLPGYTAGMNAGIEEALTTRGALAHLNPTSKWIQLARELDAEFVLPESVATMMKYEAPKLLALATLSRKLLSQSADLTLAELDKNLIDSFKLLRKLSNRSDLSLISTSELKADVLELLPMFELGSAHSETVISLISRMLDVTHIAVTYTAGSKESFKRQVRLWSSQLLARASEMTGCTASANGSTLTVTSTTGGGTATVVYDGPFASQNCAYQATTGVSAVKDFFDALDVMIALVENVRLFKTYDINSETGLVSFHYTVEQLRKLIVEYIVDFDSTAFKRTK